MQLIGETDGNMGAQIRKLEDVGYIGMRKAFQGRRPVHRPPLPITP